ncbi:MAG TPA: ATP-binding protein [Acetobacteraceae bacterium]|jgi:two-component sensor histidine kinase|nr:ATP-binding protein [Acetobacteraceae bacterium]
MSLQHSNGFMLHTVSWPVEAVQPPAPVRPLFRFTRCGPQWTRWLLALAMWLAAAMAQWLLDGLVVSGPFLTFLPAIALTTAFCGRRQAVMVIVLAVAVCALLWLPPIGLSLALSATPISLALFVLVGLFELILVDSLYRASRSNAEQQDRLKSLLRLREIMVREMRHRVANQLHLITAMLEGSQSRIDGGAKVKDVIGQAIRRISSITYLQRIVDDKTRRQRGLAPLLRDILSHIFEDVDVAVQVRTAQVDLQDHQVTIVCLIVIEAAMNALKHIFRLRRGCMFAVELRKIADGRLVLTIWDDGPGFDPDSVLANPGGLGLSIMQELAAELGGRMSLGGDSGTTVKLEFTRAQP